MIHYNSLEFYQYDPRRPATFGDKIFLEFIMINFLIHWRNYSPNRINRDFLIYLK
jgi:hypothetical protein